MKDYILNKVLSIFLIFQVLFVGYISQYPEWVEKYYSKGIYIVISGFFRRGIGWIPISIGDLVYTLLFLFLLRWIWVLFLTRISPFRKHLYAAGGVLSIFFFFFHLFWGLNYYRLPLYQRMGYKNLNYTKEQLISSTKKQIIALNHLHRLLVEDDSTIVKTPYKRSEIYKMARHEYRQLYVDSLDFHFNVKSSKSSLFSVPMSYMGFSGYLNPFTGEMQVNRKIPKSGFPTTVCHEMAHQLGYATESEANYIGYLACVNSDDLYFKYSANLMAIRYLLHNISKYDKDLYHFYRKKLNYGIDKDIQISHDFWDAYHTPIEPIFKKIYDTYLKANRQKEGIKSYAGFVAYLVVKDQKSKKQNVLN